ncbi:hypothetical protein KUCAC02_028414, partial [Chaenocephalus aceratus]
GGTVSSFALSAAMSNHQSQSHAWEPRFQGFLARSPGSGQSVCGGSPAKLPRVSQSATSLISPLALPATCRFGLRPLTSRGGGRRGW